MSLPLGADSTLSIVLQDFVGRSFPSDLQRVRLGLHITNSTSVEARILGNYSNLYIRAKADGVSSLTVYLLDDPSIYDVIVVSVGSVINPASPVRVHVGGVINFEVVKDGKGRDKQRWYSEDPSVVKIDPYTGRAVVLREANTHVVFNDVIQYKSKVNAFRATKLVMDTTSLPRRLTNIKNSENYRDRYVIPFRVYDGDREITILSDSGALIDNNLDFNCFSSHEDWVITTAEVTYNSEERRQVPKCYLTPKELKSSAPDSVNNSFYN